MEKEGGVLFHQKIYRAIRPILAFLAHSQLRLMSFIGLYRSQNLTYNKLGYRRRIAYNDSNASVILSRIGTTGALLLKGLPSSPNTFCMVASRSLSASGLLPYLMRSSPKALRLCIGP
jgi:hypothetical protein